MFRIEQGSNLRYALNIGADQGIDENEAKAKGQEIAGLAAFAHTSILPARGLSADLTTPIEHRTVMACGPTCNVMVTAHQLIPELKIPGAIAYGYGGNFQDPFIKSKLGSTHAVAIFEFKEGETTWWMLADPTISQTSFLIDSTTRPLSQKLVPMARLMLDEAPNKGKNRSPEQQRKVDFFMSLKDFWLYLAPFSSFEKLEEHLQFIFGVSTWERYDPLLFLPFSFQRKFTLREFVNQAALRFNS